MQNMYAFFILCIVYTVCFINVCNSLYMFSRWVICPPQIPSKKGWYLIWRKKTRPTFREVIPFEEISITKKRQVFKTGKKSITRSSPTTAKDPRYSTVEYLYFWYLNFLVNFPVCFEHLPGHHVFDDFLFSLFFAFSVSAGMSSCVAVGAKSSPICCCCSPAELRNHRSNDSTHQVIMGHLPTAIHVTTIIAVGNL